MEQLSKEERAVALEGQKNPEAKYLHDSRDWMRVATKLAYTKHGTGKPSILIDFTQFGP